MIIQRALGVGFTLEELATLFRARDRGQHPCRDVRALAERKLHDVERQLEDLVRFREALEQMLRDWDRRLAKRKGDGPARLLEVTRLGAAIRIVSPAGARLRPREKTKGAGGQAFTSHEIVPSE